MENLSGKLDNLIENKSPQKSSNTSSGIVGQQQRKSSSSSSSSASSSYSSASLSSSYSSFSSCVSSANNTTNNSNGHYSNNTNSNNLIKPTVPPKPKISLTETTSKLFMNTTRYSPSPVSHTKNIVNHDSSSSTTTINKLTNNGDYEGIINSLKEKIKQRSINLETIVKMNTIISNEKETINGNKNEEKKVIKIPRVKHVNKNEVNEPPDDRVNDDHSGGGSLLDEIYAEIEEKSNIKIKKNNSSQFKTRNHSYSSSTTTTTNTDTNECCSLPPLPTVPPPPLSTTTTAAVTDDFTSNTCPLTLEEEIQLEIQTKLCDKEFFLTKETTPPPFSKSKPLHTLLVNEDLHSEVNKNNETECGGDDDDDEDDDDETEYLEPIILQQPSKPKVLSSPVKSLLNEKSLNKLLNKFQAYNLQSNFLSIRHRGGVGVGVGDACAATPPSTLDISLPQTMHTPSPLRKQQSHYASITHLSSTPSSPSPSSSTSTTTTSNSTTSNAHTHHSSSFSLSPSKLKSYILKASSSASSSRNNKVSGLTYSSPPPPPPPPLHSSTTSRSSSSSHARTSFNYLVNASNRLTSTLRLIRTKSSTNTSSYSPSHHHYNNSNSEFTCAWSTSPPPLTSNNTTSISKPTLISQTFDMSKQNLIEINHRLSGNRFYVDSQMSKTNDRAISSCSDDSFNENSVCDDGCDDLSPSLMSPSPPSPRSSSSSSSTSSSAKSSTSQKCLNLFAPITITSNMIITNVYEEDGRKKIKK
jgi:hypothetical protein